MLRNDRLLRALKREPVDRTPIWIMRQAGRYLPEYRASRRRAGDFLSLCKTPEWACEVTLQPLERFALDAAILFSDILTIPDAMGLGLTIEEGVGPRFAKPVRTHRDIAALSAPDPTEQLRYVLDAVTLIRNELDGRVPLIGFAGSPWTLATYMVEGGSSKDFSQVKTLLYADPAAMHQILEVLCEAVSAYLRAQIEAGAQAVMIFDTWGGVLTSRDYQRFSLDYMARIVADLRSGPRVPVIVFTKGGGLWLEQMAACGCDALGLDWTMELGRARALVGDRVALQGNMDPNVLHAAPERIRDEVRAILDSFGTGAGHVFNLGHGVQPHTDPDRVAVLVDAVHEFSATRS